MIEFVLPWPPAECSPNARGHWAKRAKAAKAYRGRCWRETLAHRRKLVPAARYVLHLEFVPPTRARFDDDNLVARFKSGRDGIADALDLDDTRFITRPVVSDTTGGFVRVRLVPAVQEE